MSHQIEYYLLSKYMEKGEKSRGGDRGEGKE